MAVVAGLADSICGRKGLAFKGAKGATYHHLQPPSIASRRLSHHLSVIPATPILFACEKVSGRREPGLELAFNNLSLGRPFQSPLWGHPRIPSSARRTCV